MRNENDVKKNWNFRCTEHLNRLMTFISRWLTYVLLHANKVQHHQRTSIVAISKNEDAIQEYMKYKRGRSLCVALVAKLINLMIYFLVWVSACWLIFDQHILRCIIRMMIQTQNLTTNINFLICNVLTTFFDSSNNSDHKRLERLCLEKSRSFSCQPPFPSSTFL